MSFKSGTYGRFSNGTWPPIVLPEGSDFDGEVAVGGRADTGTEGDPTGVVDSP
jgi:hypothetical protein